MNVAIQFPDDETPAPPAVGPRQAKPRTVPVAVPIPMGFLQLTDRRDNQPLLLRFNDIRSVVKMPNPKDGTVIVLRESPSQNLAVDEDYATVLARMNECYDRARNEDRGY